MTATMTPSFATETTLPAELQAYLDSVQAEASGGPAADPSLLSPSPLSTTPETPTPEALPAELETYLNRVHDEAARQKAENSLFPPSQESRFQDVPDENKFRVVEDQMKRYGTAPEAIAAMTPEQKLGMFDAMQAGDRIDRDNDARRQRLELPRIGGDPLKYHLDRASVLPFRQEATPETFRDAREDIASFQSMLRSDPNWKDVPQENRHGLVQALTAASQRLGDAEANGRATPEDLSLAQEALRSARRHYEVGWARGIGGVAQMLGADEKKGWAADLVAGANAGERDPDLAASTRANTPGMNWNRATNVFTDGLLSIGESMLPATAVGKVGLAAGLAHNVALRTGQGASLAMMGANAAGNTFADVRQALESRPDLTDRQKFWWSWSAGAISGAFEAGTELIPFEVWQKKIVGRAMGAANERALVISKNKLIDYIQAGAMAHQSEWWSENLSNVGQSIADAIKEDPKIGKILGEANRQYWDSFAQTAADNAVATASSLIGGGAAHASELAARNMTDFLESPEKFLRKNGVKDAFVAQGVAHELNQYMQTGDRKAMEEMRQGLLLLAQGKSPDSAGMPGNAVERQNSAKAAYGLISAAMDAQTLSGRRLTFGEAAMEKAATSAKPSDRVRVDSIGGSEGRPGMVFVSVNGDMHAATAYASNEDMDSAVEKLTDQIQKVQASAAAKAQPRKSRAPGSPATSPAASAAPAAAGPTVTRTGAAPTAAQAAGTAREALPPDRAAAVAKEFTGKRVTRDDGEWKVTGVDAYGDLEMLGPQAKRDTWTPTEFAAHDRAAGETPAADPAPVLATITDPATRDAAAALKPGATLDDTPGRTWRYEGLAPRGLVYQQVDAEGVAVGQPRVLPFAAAVNPAAEFAAKPVAIPAGAPAFTAESPADPAKRATGSIVIVPLENLTGGHGLQERDRSRTASRAQVETIKANFSPRRLIADAGTSDTGAPLIDTDHRILGGYGRQTALAELYDSHESAQRAGTLVAPPAGVAPEVHQRYAQAQAKGETGDPRILAYQDAMREAGFDTAAAGARPVLARVAQNFENATPADFARHTNARATLGMGPAEQAMADAKVLSTPGLLNGYDPTVGLRAAPNAAFAAAFAAKANDTAGMFDRDGRLNAAGEARMSRGIIAALLTDNPAAMPALDALFENGTDPAVVKLLTALAPAAPELLKLGSLHPEYDLRNALARAIPEAIRAAGEIGPGRAFATAADWYNQPSLIGGVPGDIRELAWYLVTADSARRISAMFSAYVAGAQHAATAAATPDMFGTAETAAPDRYALMRAAAQKELLPPAPAAYDQQKTQEWLALLPGTNPPEYLTMLESSVRNKAQSKGNSKPHRVTEGRHPCPTRPPNAETSYARPRARPDCRPPRRPPPNP